MAEKNAEQNFYLANDNKDCIQVKGEIGLTNLWQRHLTKIPAITLESAEAIIAKYPMPSKLIEVSLIDQVSNVLAWMWRIN